MNDQPDPSEQPVGQGSLIPDPSATVPGNGSGGIDPPNGSKTQKRKPLRRTPAEASNLLLNFLMSMRKRSPTKIKVFRQYFDTYYFHLINEYNSLPKEIREQNKDIADRLNSINEQDGSEWYDVFDLERIVLELLPPDAIKSRAWLLRERYRQTVPTEAYKAYLDSHPPEIIDGDVQSIEAVRADLLRILHEFHWVHAITLLKEELRRRLLNILAIFLGVVIVISSAYLVLPVTIENLNIPILQAVKMGIENTPAVFTVLLVGILGGIVSTLFRLFNTYSIGSEPVRDVVQLQQAQISMVVSPILGGVFAVVLFVILVGQFITGPILPNFTVPAISSDGNVALRFFDFWKYTGPATAKDSAILLIWSFLAGFAERLVPDALDRIAKTSEGKVV